MQKSFFLTISFIYCVVFSLAQIPPGYYDSAEGKTGIQLKAALHNIIKNHTSVSYSSLLTHFKATDKKPDGHVWDMYSDIPDSVSPYVYTFTQNCGNYAAEGDCWNREHSWPQSWFNGNAPMYSDLFHLVPTDGYVNGKRSNYPFGEVGTVTWTSMNGSKLGYSSFPGYSGIVFEPIDDYKGDFARIFFYMVTRYYTEDAGWQSNDMVDKANLKPWALALLVQWSKDDTVSRKEIDRNNAVYGIQHNRNPFVDHPEYVKGIWDTISTAAVNTENHVIRIFPNPAVIKVHIELPLVLKDSEKVTILDLLGHEVFSYENTAFQGIDVDITAWNPGTYIVICSENGFTYRQKLVVINQ